MSFFYTWFDSVSQLYVGIRWGSQGMKMWLIYGRICSSKTLIFRIGMTQNLLSIEQLVYKFLSPNCDLVSTKTGVYCMRSWNPAGIGNCSDRCSTSFSSVRRMWAWTIYDVIFWKTDTKYILSKWSYSVQLAWYKVLGSLSTVLMPTPEYAVSWVWAVHCCATKVGDEIPKPSWPNWDKWLRKCQKWFFHVSLRSHIHWARVHVWLTGIWCTFNW